MNKRQRFENILLGILMILSAIAIVLEKDDGFDLVVIILGLSMLFAAARKILYYITLARHMIGGSMVLCNGLILMDFAFLVISLKDVPEFYVMIYMIIGLLFSAVVDILNAREAKRLASPSWKFKMVEGVISMILTILCFVFFRSAQMVVYVFCLNLVQSAVIRISEACRRTAIIYIQ